VAIHALSFDVEDWFQGFIYRNIDGWQGRSSHEEENIEKILSLLDETGTIATFFILGKFAENHARAVEMIGKAGHEIASHGYAHIPLTKLAPEEFRTDLKRSCEILAGITGRHVDGYRAASWSLMKNRLWALDVLAEEGMLYDSSMFPTSMHAYGIPGSPKHPVTVRLDSGRSIAEFPAQVLSLGALRIPAAGGFYLRAFPEWMTRRALRQSDQRGKSGMVYLHPYDIDPNVPRLNVPFVFRVIRYYNLAGTFSRLRSLLQSFRFSSIQKILTTTEFPMIEASSLGSKE